MARKRNGAKSLEVYEELKKMISSFDLFPGQLIMEGTLTERFHVSRTPVREAMYRLIQERLLIEESGRVYVAQLTLQDMVEVFQIRLALEGTAAELAAAKGSKGLAANLKALNSKMQQCLEEKDYIDYFDLDDRFHHTLIQAAGNQRLVDITDNLNLQVKRIRHLTSVNQERMRLTILEHEQVIKALAESNPLAAREAAQRHILAVQDAIYQLDFTPSQIYKTIHQLQLNAVIYSKGEKT